MLKHAMWGLAIGCGAFVSLQGPLYAGAKAGQAAAAQAQHDHDHPAPPPAAGQPSRDSGIKMHQKMMADMKAADVKLDELVAAMNSAKGDAKVSALAQVVNELVRQHKAMHEHMGMMEGMMGGGGMMKK